ncbi:prolyl 4-hydroxylase [Novosphingobium chloroacetimidivorans]|uniref:Prolyl 4-hydroxylase n=1 Tax=Novosphingobium chloroacetimidivorans TaxID=1428314 RepID=A0A7W7NYJ0_9SPHN|nr:2OG-Fe(II) oxygenase [Novosphingobium chloroacetimidivorans]MBB4860257.1 prolyl 4-hydroxylase [Novosphingobium chloroacetimidivorans]
MTRGTHNTIADEAGALALRGSVTQAYRLLEQGVAANDGIAAATLADWRLSGQIIRRDLALARDLYGRAAALGVDNVAPIHIAMLANGAGGTPRKWQQALALLRSRTTLDTAAARQLRVLDAMALTEDGDPTSTPHVTPAHQSPPIGTLAGFLTAAECTYLIDCAASSMQPSVVIHPQTGAFVRDPVRTAKSAGFPFVLEDPVLHAINRRIAAATGTTYEQGEPLQVLRYDAGDEYKLHSDALPPGQNQRTTTFLVALNDAYDGGETDFPRVPYRWRGKPGDALCFANVDAAGGPDPMAWHSGNPVTRGTKFLLSKWIRQHPLDLSGPPGRPF